MKRLLVLMLVGVMLLVGCGEAEEPIPPPQTSLVDRIAAVEGELVRLTSKVASAPDVSAIQSDLDTLREETSALRDEVGAPDGGLSEQLGALEERIEALEEEKQEEEKGDIDPEDAIEIDVQYPRELQPDYGTPGLKYGETYSLSCRVRITLENQLSVAIEDIVLSARVRVESETPGIVVVHVELMGGDFDWDEEGSNEFESWGNIKLGADSREKEESILRVTVANTDENSDPEKGISGYTVSIERLRIECEDYEVKE